MRGAIDAKHIPSQGERGEAKADVTPNAFAGGRFNDSPVAP